MQGTLVARSGAELVGGGEKALFRDDWKKISATQCTSQGTGEAVLSLPSDVTKWPLWKREAAANGGGGASRELEEMYVHARGGGRGSGVGAGGTQGCYLGWEACKVQVQKRGSCRKKGQSTRKAAGE